MADIIEIEEIVTKAKRPETFSGGLYNNAGAALGGGGTRGGGIGGLYGLAGPGSYATLARLGAEDDFRMKGVTDATAEDEAAARENIAVAYMEQLQEAAAQKYADLVLMRPTTAEDIQAVQDAKDALVALGVTREQIAATGVDASRGISGVMGPSISGAIDQGIEKGSELFGLGAERLAGLIGADEALSSALLNLPNLGATFVFDESGKKSPIITGQTPSGTQVGVNVNDPYGIADIIGGIRTGDLDVFDIIGAGGKVLAGANAATAYAGEDDNTNKTGVETGVAITPEGSTPDEPKVPAGGEGGGPNKDKGANAGAISPRTVGPGLDAGPGPSDKIPTNRTPTLALPDFPTLNLPNNRTPTLALPDFPTLNLPNDRTLTLPDFDPLETERVPTSTTTTASTTTPADKIPGGGGGGGDSGLPEQSASPTGGMRGVSVEKAGLADIINAYDPSLSLAENMQRLLGTPENVDAVDSALMYGGGIVQPTDINAEILRILGSR